jgi:hypothetical protein
MSARQVREDPTRVPDNDDLLLRRSLLSSIEVVRHTISVLPDSNDAISVHRLAPECFLVIFPTQQTRDVASMTSRTPPSPVAMEEVDACIEPMAFEAQLPPRPSASVPSQDPMLIEARAPSLMKITAHVSPRLLTAATTPLKTYRRRPRCDAARPLADAALHPLHSTPAVDPSPPPVSQELEAKRQALPSRDEFGMSCETDPLEPVAELVPDSASDPPRPLRRTGQDQVATPSKRGRFQPNDDLEAAKANIATFPASVRQELQVPLATLQAAPSPSSTSATRRSSRLAKLSTNSTVRASKKGEVLLMRKLDKLSTRPTEDLEASAADATTTNWGLAAVFAGPESVDKEYFAAFRDLFPPARALSDADLMSAVRQVNNVSYVC